MADRYDIMTGRDGTDRDGNTKTFWTKIATMFKVKDKDQFRIKFDALPIPKLYTPEGGETQLSVEAMAFPPRPDEQPQQRPAPAPGRTAPRGGAGADLGDEVPFLPEYR